MEKIYQATGSWVTSYENENEGIFDVNYSSILTHLIKEAAKCESYASDLFVDWKSIDKSLRNKELKSNYYLFGFRNMGVDHRSYVEVRGIDSEEYRSVYHLDVEVNFPDIKMTLYKIK